MSAYPYRVIEFDSIEGRPLYEQEFSTLGEALEEASKLLDDMPIVVVEVSGGPTLGTDDIRMLRDLLGH